MYGGEGKDLIIVSIYNRFNWEGLKNKIKEIMEEKKDEYILIGRDFNARIGLEEGNNGEKCNIKRKSNDKMVSSWEREFLEMMGEIGRGILKGTTEGDWESNYIYVGRKGGTMTDYIVLNEKCQGLVKNFKIDDRVDLDHMPLIVELNARGKDEKKGKKIGEKEKRSKMKINWCKEARRRYAEKIEEIDWKKEEEKEDIKEKWNRLKEVVYGALIKKESMARKKKRVGYKEWWDRNCTKKKGEVHRAYRNGEEDKYI